MDTPPSPELTVVQGHILTLRLFDIAYAIDLVAAEAAWIRQGSRAARARLVVTPPKAMDFGVPPLMVELDPVTLNLGGETLNAKVTARLYDFGAVTLVLRVSVIDLPWGQFVERMNALDESLTDGPEHTIWQRLLDRVSTAIAPALTRPSAAKITEDYHIAVVTSFDAPLNADQVLARADLVALLAGERRRLSTAARNDLLRRQFSYYEDDLVVLTWDRAFVYEPRGDSDVAEVLEVANVQLLEMRYYDELLDDELPRMNERVATARNRFSLAGARRYAGLARRFYTLVTEVTELTERVDNALQVTEDVYLARVYAAALDLFRVELVNAAVHRKLAIVRDTYTALYEEASASRSALMEAAILVLIFVELVLALLRH